MCAFKIISFFALFIFVESKLKISDLVPICSLSDPKINECIRSSTLKIVPYLVKGIREWNAMPLDPAFVPRIYTGQKGGSFSLDWEHLNVTLRGLGKTKLHQVIFKKDKDEYTFFFSASAEQLYVDADYKGEGKLSVLKIKGEGQEHLRAAIQSWNTTLHAKEEFNKSKKKKFLKVQKITNEVSFTKAHAELTNLFGGDNDLGRNINKFINENADVLIAEFRPALEETVKELMLNYIVHIFNNIPVDELFKP